MRGCALAALAMAFAGCGAATRYGESSPTRPEPVGEPAAIIAGEPCAPAEPTVARAPRTLAVSDGLSCAIHRGEVVC